MAPMRIGGFLAILAIGCGDDSSRPEETAPAAFGCAPSSEYGGIELDRCLERDARAVVAALQALLAAEHFGDAQTTDAFVALFSADSRGYTIARQSDVEDADVTLAPAAAAAYFEHERKDAPDLAPPEVHFATLEGSIAGDRAELDTTVRFVWGAGEDEFEYGYDATLVRRSGDWRIDRVRAWAIGWRLQDQGETYDAAYWRERDRLVREARAALEADPTIATRRELLMRLSDASRWREAHELAVQITASPEANATDFSTRAFAARRLGDSADARASTERMHAAPLGDTAGVAAAEFDCTDESGCRRRDLLRVEDEGSSPRGLAILEIVPREGTRPMYHLLVGHEGRWRIASFLSDGPLPNADVGTLAFEVSELALRQLVPGGPSEAVFRSSTRANDEGVELEESGWVVCIDLLSEHARCASIPESVSRRSEGRTTRARATVSFGEGTYEVSGLTGRDPRLRAGSHSIETLFETNDSE